MGSTVSTAKASSLFSSLSLSRPLYAPRPTADRDCPCGRQTLVVPAIIALIVFLLATYIIYPLWQRTRNSRYGAYLPLETISNGTQTVRARVQNQIARWLVPSTWRERLQDRLVVAGGPGSDNGYDSDEGEELDEVPEDEDVRHRLEREARRSRSSGRPDLERRLSRE